MQQLLRAESPAGDPVLILDDVFAELDAQRREAPLRGYEQVLVTAAVEEDIPDELHHHVVRIHAGTITDERPATSSGPSTSSGTHPSTGSGTHSGSGTGDHD